MCCGAIINSRIDRVVFGAKDEKSGGVVSLYNLLNDNRLNHIVEVEGGVLEEECSSILTNFFKNKRKEKKLKKLWKYNYNITILFLIKYIGSNLC